MTGKIIALLGGLAVAGLIGYRIVEAKKAAGATHETVQVAIPIEVAALVRADLSEVVLVTGSIRPANEVDVYAKVPGRIEAINVQVGDKVKSGALLASVEAKEIAWQAKAAEAAVRLARAQLDGARLEADRTKALFQGGAATQAQIDGVKVKMQLAEAQLAQAEAAAGLARQQVANARIESPIAGTVTRKNISVGAQVGPQGPLFSVQDLGALKLESSVDATAVARLKKGQLVALKVDALPGKSFEGEVSVISPSLDPLTRRAAIEITVRNETGELLPQMFASAAITLGTQQGALALPNAALKTALGKSVVYVVREGKAVEVSPRLGASDGSKTALIEGLSEGDQVAVSSLAALSDGALVKVAQPKPGAQP